MATYNYKIWFKDSEIQEIMEDWGYQIKTVRMLLFDLFPEEKEEIRKTISEAALRTKLCWKSEEELADIETRLRKFYSKEKKGNFVTCYYGDCSCRLQQELNLVPPTENLFYYESRLWVTGEKDWWSWWQSRHKYYMTTRFRLEVRRKLKDHIKTLDGNDIIL